MTTPTDISDLVTDPNDFEAMLVYADALQQKGDPHGAS
jgi:uncharacterized protein (TIGR02996 family)